MEPNEQDKKQKHNQSKSDQVNKKFEAKRKKSTTNMLKQFNLLIIVLVVLSFLVLIFVYSRIISSAASEERLVQMDRAANAITNFYEDTSEKSLWSTNELSVYMSVVAEATGSYLWLYDDTGRLLYINQVPDSAKENIKIGTDNYMYLPKDIIAIDIPEGGINFLGGNFLGLFQDDGNWVTVIRELKNNEGNKVSNLLLAHKIEPVLDSAQYLIEGIFIVFLIAVVLAMVIIVIYTRRISDPIEKLTKAATRVSNGDLSARVDISKYQESRHSYEDDDIMILVKIFNRMVEQIERGNSEQTDFIASISHDLRTPLTSIKGFINAILDGTIPAEKQDHYLGIVQNEVNRLSDLVSDMNSIILLDNDIDPNNFEEFNINETIIETVQGTEILLQEKDIAVQTNIQSGSKAVIVYGDQREISRVIYNLVTNAIKFVPDKEGIISINVDVQGRDIVLITIEDNGPGIAQDKLSHVFDRFYKVDHSRTDRSGSGLGLYICKRILQKHGQSIFAEKSESLGGAKIEFTLPFIRVE